MVGSINVSSVFQWNSFVEKAYVTLAAGVCGTHAWWDEKKDKGMREQLVLVEESEC